MASNQHQPSASRIVHLGGGVRAINIDGLTVRIAPNTLHAKTAQFTTRSYGSIYEDLERLGFSVIGVDFFSHITQAKGEAPPEWRVFNRSDSTAWSSEENARTWKGIAHSAFEQKEGHAWDLASRIGYQLRVCSWRVRQTSEAYHQQVAANSLQKKSVVGRRYEDGFVWNTYLAVQSYLVDACILRDYLAEFVATHIFGPKYGTETTHISSISALIKKVLCKRNVCGALADMLRQDTSDSGWLKTLGDYRNLVVHSAPLVHAEAKLFAITDALQLDFEGAIPLVRIPLPGSAVITCWPSRCWK